MFPSGRGYVVTSASTLQLFFFFTFLGLVAAWLLPSSLGDDECGSESNERKKKERKKERIKERKKERKKEKKKERKKERK